MSVDAVTSLVRVIEPLFADSPTFAAVLAGPDHVYRMTNRANSHIVGRWDLLGKKMTDAVPEAAVQGVLEILDDVLATGHPHYWNNVTVAFKSSPDALPVEHIVDCIYSPIFDSSGSTAGVFLHGVDNTAVERAKYALDALGDVSAPTVELNSLKKTELSFLRQLDHRISAPDCPVQTRMSDLRGAESLEEVKSTVEELESEVSVLQSAIRRRIDLIV